VLLLLLLQCWLMLWSHPTLLPETFKCKSLQLEQN